MPPVPTSSMTVLRAIAGGVAAAGADVGALLRDLGVTPAQLLDADARLPLPVLIRAWDEAPVLAGDKDFGLHLAERVPIGAFGVVDYASRHAPSLLETLRHLARYQRLVHDAVLMSVAADASALTVRHHLDFPPRGAPRQAGEMAVALWLLRARRLTGVELMPREVSFRHAAPPDLTEHRRILGLVPRFDQPANELVLEGGAAALPVLGADPALGRILDSHAETALAAMPEVEVFPALVRRAIAAALRDAPPSVASVAARVGLSARTLQRRLADEGQSFQVLVDELRRELAERYLREERLSVAEAAFLLGFSEPSAFHRAFRRWTGMTPQAWRTHPPALAPR